MLKTRSLRHNSVFEDPQRGQHEIERLHDSQIGLGLVSFARTLLFATCEALDMLSNIPVWARS